MAENKKSKSTAAVSSARKQTAGKKTAVGLNLKAGDLPKSTKPSLKTASGKKNAASKETAVTVTTGKKTKDSAKAGTQKDIGESKKVVRKKLVGEAAKLSEKSDSGYIVGLVKPTVAKEMMSELCKLYPDADCELTFKNDFELITAVIMSAQTTDVQVNKVTPKLFNKFPTASALAAANPEEVKEIIKPTGYYNNKAKSIQSCAKAIVERFHGLVPRTLEELVTLPGVGRKTANVVLGVCHNIPGWTVDTHVQRLTQRLGMTKNTDPYKIELDLQKIFPEEDWTKYSITLIWHGRRLCFARNPDCAACPLKQICPSSLEH